MSNIEVKMETMTFASTVPGETITAYSWTVDRPKGAVFLVHGFRSYVQYNFLRSDQPKPEHLCLYGEGATPEDSSLVRELNLRGLSVFGHDLVGHGRSTGIRAYFPSFAALVADLLVFVDKIDRDHNLSASGVPKFLIAHSLGGTIAITAARDHPTKFAGMALSSAATEPPAGMFGLLGRIQCTLSAITSALIPLTEIISLPKNNDKLRQAMFEADPLNTQCGVRARVGYEFLRAYADIAATMHTVTVPFLTASGELDTLVNPAAAKRFYEAAASEDKKYHPAPGVWHNLLVEDGCQEIWHMFADWITERVLPNTMN